MNWYKLAINEFSKSPETVEEAVFRYENGDEMVRYHTVYELSKMGAWDIVKKALKDKSPLVQQMAQSCLKRLQWL